MNNQDSGFSGKQLYFVADGMGGHAGGDVASALTTKNVSVVDDQSFVNAADAVDTLKKRLLTANAMLSETVVTRPELAGMGTTFCGFIGLEDEVAVAHIGDSRLYLLRDGKMKQITKDHTFVQRLVDSGRITPEEAEVHPRRSVLMRVLGDVDSAPEIDTEILDTKPGDVWLLCSDGLCGYVAEDVIEATLKTRTSLEQAVDSLIETTLNNGAPDNVTVAVIETVTPAPSAEAEKTFVGSASKDEESPQTQPISKIPKKSFSFGRRRVQPKDETQFEPRIDEYLAELIAETKRQTRNRRIIWIASILLLIGVFAGLLFASYKWSQTRYYVGTNGETVIIYQGIQQKIGPLTLSTELEDSHIPLSDLTAFQQRQVERTLNAGSLEDARNIVEMLGGG